MYKLLATDLDDTLLNENWQIGERNKIMIQKARQQGLKVIIATGRMFRSARRYAEELGIELPLISYQGALIKNHLTGEIIKQYPLPNQLALKIVESVRKFGYHLHMYYNDELIVAAKNERVLRYEKMSSCQAHEVGDLEKYLQATGIDPLKILVSEEESKLDAILPDLRELFQDSLHIAKSKSFYLEFSHPLAHKGQALADLAWALGFKQEEVIAVGDGFNDLEMLKWAGLGVAVANAQADIKAAADYVTEASNREGAVGEVIEKFILGVN